MERKGSKKEESQIDDKELNKKIMYTSGCCGAFYEDHNSLTLICPKCNNKITNLNNIVLSMRVNGKHQSTKVNILPDNKIKRFSTDETFMITNHKCNKCKAKLRYVYSNNLDAVHVCSNPKCREIVNI